jgi:preprotein translocase subunit SecG
MADILVGYIVPVIHVFACLFLIVVVLLQTGKGADMGAVFGGGSQTLFGSGGAGNLLTKLTTGTAIAFMVTSLILSYAHNRAPGSGLLDRIPDAQAPTAPVAPTPPAPTTPNAAGTSAPATRAVTIPVESKPTDPKTATGTVNIPVAPAPAAPAPAAPAAPAPAETPR